MESSGCLRGMGRCFLGFIPPPLCPSIHVSDEGLADRGVSKARVAHPDGEAVCGGGCVTQLSSQICNGSAVGSEVTGLATRLTSLQADLFSLQWVAQDQAMLSGWFVCCC